MERKNGSLTEYFKSSMVELVKTVTMKDSLTLCEIYKETRKLLLSLAVEECIDPDFCGKKQW